MSTRLPETDIANWAFADFAKKVELAERHARPKIIPGTYAPVKRLMPEALNEQFPLFDEDLRETDWSRIESRLVHECRGRPGLLEMNKAILQSTHNYAIERKIKSFKLEALPLNLAGSDYRFALPSIVRYPDYLAVIFLDVRRKGELSPTGRRYIFSVLFHQVISQYPDLAEAKREIWRYKNDEARTIVPLMAGEDIIEFDSILRDAKEHSKFLKMLDLSVVALKTTIRTVGFSASAPDLIIGLLR